MELVPIVVFLRPLGLRLDEDDMFSPPSFDEQIYYDESMPPIYEDYCDDMYAIKNKDNHETFHHDFNFQLDYASHDSYFVEFAPHYYS